MPLGEDIDVDTDAATLVVAWRSGRFAACRVVKAGGEVIDTLRGYAKDSLRLVQESRGRQYNPDDIQESEDIYLSANQEELLDTALLAQIKRGASLPEVTPDDLRKKRLALYALLVGNDPDSRLIFIRKGNPVSLATKGLVAIFDRTLTRVTHPILAFDATFDLILYMNEALIFSQPNFEALFKESDAVLAQTAKWVDDLGEILPIAEGGKAYLAGRLRQNSVMRRKVQSILRSSYLPKLTPDTLVKSMTQHGLDPTKLMMNGELVFSKETETDMLYLLNEDLWTGDFSGDQYAAARKERV
jgi:Domain of unknown function (DUF4868)